ncbi:YhgE/Pip family protein [Nocardioides soli]|uniref:Putative membrane protein n=1 Tax=Nocardioides soli TaxID=1036020 RepID=A0A7W4W0H2_9ACTN|nr:putative membrane protein [Nocardioides soli]
MTSFRIAFTELRRITSGRLPRLAVLAMILIPTLYAGLYLYANHDPYGGLTRVPAALVVADTGARLEGEEVRFGRDIADQLVDSGDFEWHEVSADEAASGVEDGSYDFALTIPAGFSAALTSPARFDPEQARLVMTTNDANSYLAGTIADTVTTKVRAAISSQVTERAATTFLRSLGDIRARLVDAADGAQRLADGLDTARSGARQLARGSDRLDQGLGTLERRTSALPSQTRRLADGAARVAAGNDEIAQLGREAATVAGDVSALYRNGRRDLVQRMREQGLDAQQRQAILAVYDDLNAPLATVTGKVRTASARLDQLASGAGQVADGADRLADATPALTSGIAQAHTGSGRLASGSESLRRGLVRLDQGADRLASGLTDGVDQIPDLSDTTVASTAGTLADPVGIVDRARAEAGSYGAGLAPFFLALAAWIGGYVLFLLVRPLSDRAIAANQAPLRVALGGWYPPALLGLAQMAVVLTVVTLGVGIEPAHVVPTLLFMMLVSITFIAIVHALNAWLGPAGQFLGLALMVLQLVTAGGTFPWQTIPTPLHGVHHVLPMSYAVDGLRQLMYGGLSGLAWYDVLVLVGWLALALALTSVAARRRRRWSIARIKPELSL